MKKIILISMIFCLFIVSGVFAQNPGDIIWSNSYGEFDKEYGYSVNLTTDGGYIMGGYSNSFGAGDNDVYLVKTDADGDTLWTRTYGGIDTDKCKSVQQCSDGGYIIAGETNSFGAGSYDVYLIKTDADGDTLWTRTFGGTGIDRAESVKETTDGDYILTGNTGSFGAGGKDVYLIKTDANGDTLWTKTYGATDDEEGHSVVLTTDSGYIIVGFTDSFGAGGKDVYLIKTDANGDTLWTNTHGGTDNDRGYAVQQCNDGGYIIAGDTKSSGAGNSDFYLVKTDMGGEALWTRDYGGTAIDIGYSLQQTTDEGYIIAGSTQSFNVGYFDIYLVKTDAIGDTLWTRTYGSFNYEHCRSVQLTTDGNYVAAGWTWSYGPGISAFWLLKIAGDSEPLIPPGYVEVDPYTGILTWGGAIFFDGFESYTAGEYLALQSDDWVTWSGTVGGPDDVLVVDELSYNGNNSIKIEGLDDDVVHLFGNLTTGVYEISHYQYFVPGYGGYFNLLHEFTGDRERDRTEWALEVYFASDGSGYINAGGYNAATFTYTQGAWVECWTMVDLDNDWAELWIDGSFVHEWQWSLQFSGGPGMNMLGAIDIWAGAPAGDLVMYYVDNVKYDLISTSDDLLGYNIYLDGTLVAFTTNFPYQLTDLVVGQIYIAGVSALYDEGESEIVEAQFTFLGTPVLPPENLTAVVATFNDVLLNWEAPGGATDEWIGWDDGTNSERKTNTAAIDDLRILLGYKVYKDGTEIVYIDDPGILTYTDIGVEPGVREYYVIAVYDEGESGPSNTESVEIILPIPQNVQAVSNYTMVTVTWDPISDGRDFVSYSVYRDGEVVATGVIVTMVMMTLPNGNYCFNITAVYDGGWESEWSDDAWVTVTESNNILIPVRTELTGNYPNPFNPTTTIKFALKEDSDVSIKIYNIKGAVVRTLIDGEMKATYHEIIWDGKDNTNKSVASGIYFYKMKAEKYTSTKKMILMK
jgi:hypothetical protein